MEEDAILLNVAGGLEIKDWSQIETHLHGRTGEQCRQRFYSRPTKKYKKGGWTQDEDESIIRLHDEHGSRWSEIAKHLPERSENCIKNRWHGIVHHSRRPTLSSAKGEVPPGRTNYDPQPPQDAPLQPSPSHTAPPMSRPLATGQPTLATSVGDPQAALATDRARARITPWTRDEDRLLLDAVRRIGAPAPRRRDWPRIALHVAGRSGRQCWQRYYQQLQADFRAGGWTAEEDAAIVEHQARLGNRWAAIARRLPCRSANAVKNRWHCFLHRRIPPPPPNDGGGGVGGAAESPAVAGDVTGSAAEVGSTETDRQSRCGSESSRLHPHWQRAGVRGLGSCQ